MSTISDTNETAVSWTAADKAAPARQSRSRNLGPLWTYLAIASMAVPAALLLFVGVVAGLPAADGELESGVRIGGYQVGTGGWEQTAIELESSLEAYLNEPVILQIGDRQHEVSPSDLGISFDIDATFERAMDVGRGGVVEAARERFIAHTSGVDVRPVVTFDSENFLETLSAVSSDVVTPPANARFALDGGKVVVEPSSDGVGVNSAEAANRLRQAAGDFDHTPVEIPTVVIEPDVSTADLEAVLADANQLAGQPILLFDRGVVWELPQSELVPLLTYADGNVSLNMDAIAHRVGTLSTVIDQPARNAEIEHAGDGTFRIASGAPERSLDVPATLNEIESALAAGENEVVLKVRERQPAIDGDQLGPLHQQVSDIMSRGLLLTWPDGEAWLNPVEYASTFEFNESEGTLSINPERMAQLIQPIADDASRPATGLRWKGGQFVTTDNSDPGRVIDVPATVSKAIDGALGGNPVVEMAIAPSPDPAETAKDIVITDMLAQTATYYGHSGTNRRINVEVGAAALDGTLVPPGGTFSFNEAVGGSTTVDDGYQMGYGIIIGADGVPQTVPSVAGGICQVSTTVFQAAFWAGMEIGIRNWHLYWIPNYGSGQGGLKGLDATVDADYGLDFTFINPTDDWIAVRSYTDGAYHYVEIWGTDQGWNVEVDEPEITNVVEADHDTIYREESPEMEPGQEVRVESAEDGFTASIHRVVKDAEGNVISDRTFNSYYQPARNVVLVAPGER